MFMLCGIVAYAVYSALISKSVTSDLTPDDIMEIDLNQHVITGTVVPGDSVGICSSITNVGTKDCLAFVKIVMPVIPSSNSPAYSFTVGSGWTKVSESAGEVVYGYESVLGSDDYTDPLCSEMTMVEMSGSDFKSIDDVNITVTGYLAETGAYGEDVGRTWEMILDGE